MAYDLIDVYWMHIELSFNEVCRSTLLCASVDTRRVPIDTTKCVGRHKAETETDVSVYVVVGTYISDLMYFDLV